MATFKDIKDEFETIAEAHASIGTFKYGNPFEITSYTDITLPLFHLNKIRRTTTGDYRKKGYKRYEVVFQVVDQFLEAEKATKGLEQIQEEMEQYALQIVEEFDKRSIGDTTEVTSPQDWFRQDQEVIEIEFLENYASQNYAGVDVSFTIDVFRECDAGAFNY